MSIKNLRNLYKRFLKFNKYYFILNSKKYSTSLVDLKLSDKVIGKFFEEYTKSSF